MKIRGDKMKNKGFTLVEILITLALLSLIMAVIVFPNAMELLRGVNKEVYFAHEKSIEEAAIDYFKVSSHELPNIGSTKVLSLQTLIDAGLISEIIDPKTKKECDSDKTIVIVTRLNEYQLNFEVDLNCESYVTKSYNKKDLMLFLDGNYGPINIGGIAYWIDRSGNNNSVRLSGTTAPTWTGTEVDGRKGYAFSGNNQYLDLNLKFSEKEYSVALWVYRYEGFPEGQYNRFVGTQSWGIGRYGLMVNNAGNLAFNTYFGPGYDYWVNTSIKPPLNEWFYVTFTINREGDVKLYYNGELVATRNISPAKSVAWASDNIRLACGATSGVYRQHMGLISDVKIYKRILTPEEVKQNYSARKK